MENNLSNKPIDKLNTYTEVKTENINNTESVTTIVLVETSYLFLAIITFVILLVIKKLSTKYHILQKYGITEKNVKIVLEYINRIIKDIIYSKLKRENIQIDFIEDNIKKSTVLVIIKFYKINFIKTIFNSNSFLRRCSIEK